MGVNLFDLKGRVAAVTGGNGGLGFGIAEGLARAGANIVVNGRDATRNQRAVDQLTALGVQAVAVQGDASDERTGEALTAGALERFGRLDILVNNVGTSSGKQPQEYDAAEWRAIMDVNLTSAFICSKAAYFEMKKTGGKIINVGSMASIFAFAYGAPYTASKGGMVQLTKALAVAWAKDNIQVNAILPGWFYTELMEKNKDGMPGLERKVLGRTPAGRWGTMADLAGVCVFLASAASDFVTGTAIPVDGGYAAQGFSDD